MGIITDSGAAAVAKAIRDQSIHLAWGTGGEEWTGNTPQEDERRLTLTNEVGRKALLRSLFVLPADDGEITVSEHGRFAISVVPTPHLYVEFVFDFQDGSGENIREYGIFIGSRVKAGLPPGQSYFTPAEIEDPGTLIMLEHDETPLERAKSRMCTVAYIITF